MDHLKTELYRLCGSYIEERIKAARYALTEAQKASNDDTKSSAGDKYETGREMMKQESDRNIAQLNEANKLKIALQQITPTSKCSTAQAGSLVITDNGNFYLAISAGKFELNGKTYFSVSAISPVGMKLKGLKSGDLFNLNNKSYTVIDVI